MAQETRQSAEVSTSPRGTVTVDPAQLVPVLKELRKFLKPFLPLFGREEARGNAGIVVRGMLSDLLRKTVEPIAARYKVNRRPLQRFVGAGPWDDNLILDELNQEVGTELGRSDAALIVDSSGFVKKGDDSVGVQRQWCGRVGKVENCQVGVYLSYASAEGHTLVDHRFYLPESWANDKVRREKCHVPEDVVFKKSWELAEEMLVSRAAELPHGWTLADDAFGRATEFRDGLAEQEERYMLDVPYNTRVKTQGQKPGRGRASAAKAAWRWAKHVPDKKWGLYTVRAGTKGPIQVKATWTRVLTQRDPKDKKSPWDREEILLVLKTVEKNSRTKYCLSNAGEGTTDPEMVRAATTRWSVEDCLERAKGEVGMGQYQVRSWTGWRHHMTLALLALWFLVRQHRRLQGAFPPFTVQQVRFCVAEFLRDPHLDVVELAQAISTTLTRNERSRLHHWDRAKPLSGATAVESG
jgi:SRSO17 transposase